MPFLPVSYPLKQIRFTLGRELVWWPRHSEARMGCCHRVLPCRMCIQSWGQAARTLLWWWGTVQPTPNSQEETLVAWAVATTVVPGLPVMVDLPEGVTEPHSLHAPKLTIRQRQGRLFEELDLSGLKSWSLELTDSVWLLLAEYPDVFLLEPSELSCTHTTEHVIKVMDDTPFKERFRWIPPLLVEEVHNHLHEMLDSGAIWPSQSVWCNAVVLVRKKDGSQHFCIDFCLLNACMKKTLTPCWKFNRC